MHRALSWRKVCVLHDLVRLKTEIEIILGHLCDSQSLSRAPTLYLAYVDSKSRQPTVSRNLPLWVSLPMHWPRCTNLSLATCMQPFSQSCHVSCVSWLHTRGGKLRTLVALLMMLALTYSTLFWWSRKT